MDADTERRLISALGTLGLIKGTVGKFQGLTERQGKMAETAMAAIGDILLEEEAIRKADGEIYRQQVKEATKIKQWGAK